LEFPMYSNDSTVAFSMSARLACDGNAAAGSIPLALSPSPSVLYVCP
jgi:hypothetical protein